MPLPQEEIKRRISAARIIRGMSQAEFDARGAADGFGKGEMSRVERGELQFREGKHLDAMRRYLDVPAWWFTADTITMPDESAAHARAGAADDQMDRLEAKLDALLDRFEALATRAQAQRDEAIDRIEALERALTEKIVENGRAAEDEEWVERVVAVAREALRGDAQSPGSARRTRAKSGSPQG